MTRRKSDLSPRQLEVLRGLAAGMTRTQVARKLGVSNGTLDSHLENIFDFLGAANSVEAVIKGLQTAPRELSETTSPGRVRVRTRLVNGELRVTLMVSLSLPLPERGQ